MPGLDLCAAGLCRKSRALLPEKGHQAAAAQGRVYFGRGAVATTIVGWAKAHLRRAHHLKISRRFCVEMVGTLALCPPYDSVMASAGSTVISGHSVFQRLAFAA